MKVKKMAKAGRIVGGIFSIIGSGIVLIMAWVFWLLGLLAIITGISTWVAFTIFLIVGILGVTGGILLLVDKRAGGILAIIGGAGDLIYTINFIIALSPMPWPVIILFLIPSILLLSGGIVGTATSSEFG